MIEITRMGLPVPQGFILPCKLCIIYQDNGAWPDGLKEQLFDYVAQLEEKTGRHFGDVDSPLVLVRSGAFRIHAWNDGYSLKLGNE